MDVDARKAVNIGPNCDSGRDSSRELMALVPKGHDARKLRVNCQESNHLGCQL
jgi:hypothetical protein